ncbi:hypothetical protein BGZ65_001970 [Modicella reniformis]|uniref:CASTOR ACT domain-containing protein n=1 Tax=Modicella reniformis TaxID=1440133 RepID=A0A9P6J4H6_9FUNG|nr:hypothetical protein BGZ65_001970 [Modicella reniformis]
MAMKLELELDLQPFTIHRFPPSTPASIYLPLVDHQTWYSITKTPEEISLVISHDYPDTQENKLISRNGSNDDGYEHKIMPTYVGIMANLSGILAENKISVFVVSTYDTDYILVKEDKALEAKKAFEANGHNIHGL